MSKTKVKEETSAERETRLKAMYDEYNIKAEEILNNLPDRKPYLLKQEDPKFDKCCVWFEELFLTEIPLTYHLPIDKLKDKLDPSVTIDDIYEIFSTYKSIKMPIERKSIIKGIPLSKIIDLKSSAIHQLGMIWDKNLTEYGKSLVEKAGMDLGGTYLEIAGPDDNKSLYLKYHHIIGSRRLCFLKPDENGNYIY